MIKNLIVGYLFLMIIITWFGRILDHDPEMLGVVIAGSVIACFGVYCVVANRLKGRSKNARRSAVFTIVVMLFFELIVEVNIIVSNTTQTGGF